MTGKSLLFALIASLVPGVALAQVDPFDPGTASANPGTGCQIGTSGCFPSAPPGPQTPAADPGAITEIPPPVVDPQSVPFYGTLPGPAGQLEAPQATPEKQRELAAQEQRAHQQRLEALLEQQTNELAAQRQQIQDQTDELAAEREQLEALQDQMQQQSGAGAQQPAGQAPAQAGELGVAPAPPLPAAAPSPSAQ
ncbi:MAG TPA: hypothetical protein VII38_01870 [Polyangia bacterium]